MSIEAKGAPKKKIDLGSVFLIRTLDTEPTNLRNHARDETWLVENF